MHRSNHFNTIHYGGKLMAQYVVDGYAKMESQRLRYLANNQDQLRQDIYRNIADAYINAPSIPRRNCIRYDGQQIPKSKSG